VYIVSGTAYRTSAREGKERAAGARGTADDPLVSSSARQHEYRSLQGRGTTLWKVEMQVRLLLMNATR